MEEKYCKFCGSKVHVDAVICTACGRQIEELKHAEPAPAQNTQTTQPSIVITNNNESSAQNASAYSPYPPYGVPYGLRPKDKVVALLLCFFLGWLGAHRFYEGKIVTGIIWFFTMGLLGVGVLVDFIILLFKPNPYYV